MSESPENTADTDNVQADPETPATTTDAVVDVAGSAAASSTDADQDVAAEETTASADAAAPTAGGETVPVEDDASAAVSETGATAADEAGAEPAASGSDEAATEIADTEGVSSEAEAAEPATTPTSSAAAGTAEAAPVDAVPVEAVPAEDLSADEAPAPSETTAADSQTGTAAGAPEPAADTANPTVDAPAESTPEAGPADDAPQPAATAVPATPSAAPSAASARPAPRPVPRPLARPAAPTAVAAAPVAVGPDETALIAKAKEFGKVSDDGTVSVIEAGVERVVGQVPGATGDDAIALYVRRYLDLRSKILIFEARLAAADLSQHEVQQTLTKLTEETVEPSAVGDLEALRTKIAELRGIAKKQAAAAEEARAAARAEAIVERTALVEEAEALAGTDPSRIQWKTASEQLRLLLDRWKTAQKNGPRIDRPTEEELWKRFSHARTSFDRERRHFFAELERHNSEAKTVKEKLVAEAERLSSSTEWAATAGAYRDLMTEWKAAGRASRRDDDALWARFRAAQDTFFKHRDEVNSAIDAEYAANLTVKEGLLTEAEALLPITNLTTVKNALRDIQDRWEEAGKVPREAIQRVEGRLRAVEKAVRDHEQEQWDRSNPETKARAEGAAAQLQSAIADLEADLAAAEAKGDKRRVKEITEGIAARRSWLDQILKTADGS